MQSLILRSQSKTQEPNARKKNLGHHKGQQLVRGHELSACSFVSPFFWWCSFRNSIHICVLVKLAISSYHSLATIRRSSCRTVISSFGSCLRSHKLFKLLRNQKPCLNFRSFRTRVSPFSALSFFPRFACDACAAAPLS